jgi:hypothetical protein
MSTAIPMPYPAPSFPPTGTYNTADTTLSIMENVKETWKKTWRLPSFRVGILLAFWIMIFTLELVVFTSGSSPGTLMEYDIMTVGKFF